MEKEKEAQEAQEEAHIHHLEEAIAATLLHIMPNQPTVVMRLAMPTTAMMPPKIVFIMIPIMTSLIMMAMALPQTVFIMMPIMA